MDPNSFTSNGIFIKDFSNISSTLTGLTCGTNYNFYIIATDYAGNRTWSKTLSVNTLPCTGGARTSSNLSFTSTATAYPNPASSTIQIILILILKKFN